MKYAYIRTEIKREFVRFGMEGVNCRDCWRKNGDHSTGP